MKQLVLLAMFLLHVACESQVEPYVPPEDKEPDTEEEEIVCHERGKEVFDLINQYFMSPVGGLYKESYPHQNGDPQFSYLWPFVGLVDGTATLATVGYNVDYSGKVDTYEKYFREQAYDNNLGGYGSSTDGTIGQGTRFYDDNAIVGLSLLEAYDITGDEKYLQRASRIVPFLMSGEDDKLGGGIWWNEDEKYNVNSNSHKGISANGYGALFLLNYLKVCHESEKADVLAFAKRLYSWVRETLYDSGNNTYANSIDAEGNIDHTRWTYNSGVMIQNGLRLYQATGEQAYLDEAIVSAQGAYDYYVKPRNDMALTYPDHDPWFNVKLLEAYIDMVPFYANAETYVDAYYQYINYGYENARTDNGLFYEDWTGGSPRRYYLLLMQVAVVESYGELAVFFEEEV